MHQEEAKGRGISEAKATTNSQFSGRLLVNRSLPKMGFSSAGKVSWVREGRPAKQEKKSQPRRKRERYLKCSKRCNANNSSVCCLYKTDTVRCSWAAKICKPELMCKGLTWERLCKGRSRSPDQVSVSHEFCSWIPLNCWIEAVE